MPQNSPPLFYYPISPFSWVVITYRTPGNCCHASTSIITHFPCYPSFTDFYLLEKVIHVWISKCKVKEYIKFYLNRKLLPLQSCKQFSTSPFTWEKWEVSFPQFPDKHRNIKLPQSNRWNKARLIPKVKQYHKSQKDSKILYFF